MVRRSQAWVNIFFFSDSFVLMSSSDNMNQCASITIKVGNDIFHEYKTV